ncbi:unnamed protein product [Peronospora belbahrii]|uniref:Uncharacterized protein n=1 Tax=Peronospora belbahrii TaxID=622444 RepID=A0AAU9L3I1_9STRA|nr:unnamed protein product [Peronospora belbahrii]CAH0522164.1 unnamed protein product [Peronospora belbahrii]
MHWMYTGPIPELADKFSVEGLAFSQELREPGIVFEARPQLHRFPWAGGRTYPSARSSNGRPSVSKKVFVRPLGNSLDRLEERTGHDEWQRAALGQTPKQALHQRQRLTTYQV